MYLKIQLKGCLRFSEHLTMYFTSHIAELSELNAGQWFSMCVQGIGVVVRIAAMTTESVYKFLHHQLTCLEPLLGMSPYR